MANIADLVVSLKADIADFRTGMDQANKSLGDMKSQFASAQEAASSFIEKIGEIVAAREVVAFLEESAEATRNWAEQLSTFQGLAGLSSTAAATLAGATQLAGVGADVVTAAMARLGTTISTHPQKFEQLGIAIRDSSGQLLPMTDILRNTIAGLDQFKAGTDRATAAGFLFGRGAETWMTQLDKLGPELQAGQWSQTADLVKALGLSMENAKATAEQWAQAQGTLKLELLGVENQIGQALLPAIQTLGSEIATFAKNGDLKAWAEDAARAVVGLTLGLAELADFVVEHNKVFGTIFAVGGAVTALDTGSIAAAGAAYSGWKMTETGADEAAAKVHEDMQKMIADLKAAQQQIGSTKESAGGATGDWGTPDGTKTFNVPDPKQQQLNDSITTLIANFQREIQQNQALAAAMNQGGDAAKKLADQFQALNKIDAIRAQALRDGLTLSDEQIQKLTALAQAEGQSAEVLQRSTQLHNNLADAMKKQDDAMQKLVQSADLLTPKEQEIADKEGALWAAFNQGAISAQQFNDAIKQLTTQLNGPDKGMKEPTSGLSADFSSLLGKLTDFNGLVAASQQKGNSIFKQLGMDASDFIKTLGELVLKLTVINPLLNSLGLGDQGNGKQLPTLGLLGNSSQSAPAPAGSNSLSDATSSTLPAFDAGLSHSTSIIQSFIASIAAAIAAIKAMAASSSSSSASGGLGGLGGLGSLGGGGAAGGDAETPAFAQGGDFTVAGSGGTDSRRVSFLATPGEHVSVMSELAQRSSGNSNGRGAGGRGDVHISMPISGVHADSFRANKHQITGDILRALSSSRRYA
jgi:hypothetical protein